MKVFIHFVHMHLFCLNQCLFEFRHVCFRHDWAEFTFYFEFYMSR